MNSSGWVTAGWCPGQDALPDTEVKPWLARQQAEGPAPARCPPGRGGVTSPTRTNAHSSQATCEKEITQGFTISSFTLYPVPSTPQLFMACFCVAVGRNTMWVPSRAAASRPACWGARQSPSASGSSPEPASVSTLQKCYFSLCELLQLFLLLCISETKISSVLQHPLLHTTILLHQTQTCLTFQNPIIIPIIEHVVGPGSR